jgi:hypothetical protein
MSTLFSQEPRKYHRVSEGDIDDFLTDAKELASKLKIELKDVIAAKHVLELQRRNDLYAANGDALDEQLAGFGDVLRGIQNTLSDIVDK